MSIEFKHILFPTDFSDLSVQAVPYVRHLATMFGARIHCIHIVDEAFQYWSAMGPESVPVQPAMDDLLDAGKTRLHRLVTEQLADVTPPPIMHVAVGRPFAEIIGYARRNDVDLIVMATHGRGAIAHVLLGSTTEKVVRKAPCAVMTIRNRPEDFVMP